MTKPTLKEALFDLDVGVGTGHLPFRGIVIRNVLESQAEALAAKDAEIAELRASKTELADHANHYRGEWLTTKARAEAALLKSQQDHQQDRRCMAERIGELEAELASWRDALMCVEDGATVTGGGGDTWPVPPLRAALAGENSG